MKKSIAAALAFAAIIAGITVFHLVHHALFCRYRNVPGKSHCGICGHHKVCRKWHHRS